VTADEMPDQEVENPSLLSIAKALSDGVPVDWEDEEGDDDALRLMKERLRFVESVAEAHRRMRDGRTPDPGEDREA